MTGVVMLLGGLLALVPGGPAAACEVDATGICLEGTEPGSPSSGTTAPTEPGPTNPGDETGGCRDESGAVIACTDGYGGSWSGAPRWCYQYLLEPQPPASSPLWGGRDPTAGSLWSCDYSLAAPGNTFFVPDGQAVVAVVDAETVARDLMRRADFAYADAFTAPGGSSPTYVSYATWLWVPSSQWHPVSVSLTVAGATITIQGVPTSVEWQVGPHRRSCDGPGRAWDASLGEDAQTTCSIEIEHLADPDGDELQVVARIQYAVTWACSGRCSETSGDFGIVSALSGRTASLEVRQRQTVVTS